MVGLDLKKYLTILLVLVLAFPMPVNAQESGPHVADSTIPVTAELRAAVDELLAANPPVATANNYVITYARYTGVGWKVSVAAVTDPVNWHIDEALWWGSMLVVFQDGNWKAQYYSAVPNGGAKRASPRLAAGGGSYVRLPFQSGKSAMYGTRGVHGGFFGTPGAKAVDWVSGADFGANAANDSVYASDSGVVDQVCEDGTSVAIRTYNASSGDYFIYLHLNDNANLEMDHNFSRGATIGSLRHGSFNDDCGWAEQADNHWHVHWGFIPSGGTFQAEGCILDISSEVWDCGGHNVSPGEWTMSDGGSDDGTDDAGDAPPAGFFDYLLSGLLGFGSSIIISNLVEHTEDSYVGTVLTNGIIVVFVVSYVLLKGSVDLWPVLYMIGIILLLESIRLIIYAIIIILRFLDSIPGIP